MSKSNKRNRDRQKSSIINGNPVPAPVDDNLRGRMVAMSYSGPLPHPDDLERYGQIVEGGANRILVLLENQTGHRISIERSVIRTDNWRSIMGMICGFIVAVLGIMGSIYLAYHDKQLAAGILGGSTLGSIVAVFVVGTRTRMQNIKKK